MLNKNAIAKSFILFLLCEFFLAIFQIFRYRIIFLIISEFMILVPFIYEYLKLNKKRKTLFICSAFIFTFLLNFITIGLYLLDRYKVSKFGLLNYLVYSILLFILSIMFIKLNKIMISLKKTFLSMILSYILSILIMLIRISIIKPSLLFLFKILDYYNFPTLIKSGILVDYSVIYFCFLFFCYNSSPPINSN